MNNSLSMIQGEGPNDPNMSFTSMQSDISAISQVSSHNIDQLDPATIKSASQVDKLMFPDDPFVMKTRKYDMRRTKLEKIKKLEESEQKRLLNNL